MLNEVAGNIQIKRFGKPDSVNAWLLENPDLEILDIQIATCETEDSYMVVYRPESEVEA